MQIPYEGSETLVRCVVGVTDRFKVEVGIHQGSALRPCLFAVVMDRLTDEVRQESPWIMIFADDMRSVVSRCKTVWMGGSMLWREKE